MCTTVILTSRTGYTLTGDVTYVTVSARSGDSGIFASTTIISHIIRSVTTEVAVICCLVSRERTAASVIIVTEDRSRSDTITAEG